MRQLNYKIVTWPARGTFKISRSALNEFVTVQVYISDAGHIGRAECRPYARYDETAQSVIAQILIVKTAIENGMSRERLKTEMPAGAARNAMDCALWDLEAKINQRRAWDIAGVPAPQPRSTAFTLSMDEPRKMADAARTANLYKLLKVKIGSENGVSAIDAILKARPDARLIVDANEAISAHELKQLRELELAENIALIEQPFPAKDDHASKIDGAELPPVCADESLHTSKDLERLWAAGYRAVNVKLDKTGGLTEALNVMTKAKAMGFKIMAGCMVGSSLAMAPMVILESFADFIDLDGPLLLSDDYTPPLTYKGGKIFPPSKDLWG